MLEIWFTCKLSWSDITMIGRVQKKISIMIGKAPQRLRHFLYVFFSEIMLTMYIVNFIGQLNPTRQVY